MEARRSPALLSVRLVLQLATNVFFDADGELLFDRAGFFES